MKFIPSYIRVKLFYWEREYDVSGLQDFVLNYY